MSEPEVVNRSYWEDSARGGAAIDYSGVRGIANHWPASRGSFGVESKEKVASRLRGWRNYHVGVRGWSDIGYNMAVDQAGRIWDLRGIYRVGAHCASASNPRANHYWVGVLFIVGMDEAPTAAMVNAYRYLRREIVFEIFGSDANDIRGHREVPGAQTSCPGNVIIGLEGKLNDPWDSGESDDVTDLPDKEEKEIAREVAGYRQNWNNYAEKHIPEVVKKWKDGYRLAYMNMATYVHVRRLVGRVFSKAFFENIAFETWARENYWAGVKQGFLQYRMDVRVAEIHDMVSRILENQNENSAEFHTALAVEGDEPGPDPGELDNGNDETDD